MRELIDRARKVMDDWGDLNMRFNLGQLTPAQYFPANLMYGQTYTALENEIRRREANMRPRTPER